MNEQTRRNAKQAVLWAVTAADARAEGDEELAEHAERQAQIHQDRMRELQRDAFLAGEYEQVS